MSPQPSRCLGTIFITRRMPHNRLHPPASKWQCVWKGKETWAVVSWDWYNVPGRRPVGAEASVGKREKANWVLMARKSQPLGGISFSCLSWGFWLLVYMAAPARKSTR